MKKIKQYEQTHIHITVNMLLLDGRAIVNE